MSAASASTPAVQRVRGKRRRTPTLLQMEAADCGAASLGIILGYLGRHVSLDELRQACGVSRDGSKASNIIKAAKSYGLHAKGWKYELATLSKTATPLIVFWNFNHFLVVEGFGKDVVYLNDPATGPRKVTYEEFDQAYTGVALTFAAGPQFQKKQDGGRALAALWSRLRGSRQALVYVILVGLLLVGPGLLVPSFGRIFVDEILIAGQRRWLYPLLLAMSMTMLLRAALMALHKRYLGRFETTLALAGASLFLWHLLRLPVAFFNARQAGDLSARVDDNERLARLLSGELAENAINVVMVVFYAILIYSYDPVLWGIGVSTAGLNVVALRWVGRQRVDRNLRMQQDTGKLLGTGVGGIQLIESLKAGGMENDFFVRFAGSLTKVVNAEQELAVANELLRSLPSFLNALNSAALLAVGALRVMDGRLSMGELVAVQSLMVSFLAPVHGLVGLVGSMQQVQGTLSRLEDVLKNAPDAMRTEQATRSALPLSRVRLSGAVELRGLTFGYSPLAPALLENFHLRLRPGSRVALVGGSGSGKSTVAKLASGLFAPWTGEILFDGVPRQQLPRTLLQTSVAMVDQDIFLFTGSVRDNITMWDKTIPEQQMVAAAKDALIHEEISQRDGGYDAQVEEGGRNFSGGQRQRLEVARALAVHPSILILDEATSALDPIAEKMIDRNLRRRGCTCIIIAHRLSTIRDCDEILLLDGGKVVERGTHEELRRRDGQYARLIRST